MKTIPLLLCAFLLAPAEVLAEFSFSDSQGKRLEILENGKPIARYVYEAIDDSTPERREETFKPFCHVFRPGSNELLLTKGPGGKFTHHRGIFYGFSKVSYTGEDGKVRKGIDTWHCRQAHQIHREFLEQNADAESASFVARIDWIDNEGAVFASEDRKMSFFRTEGDLVVDFESTLAPAVPEVKLDGDPQHAGFQFRAHNDVHDLTKAKTVYTRPETGAAKPGETINWADKTDNERTRDLPWKGMTFELDGATYSVAYLDSPGNPKPARYSERDYGRFGSYFATTVKKNEPLTVRYRLHIRKGGITAEEITAASKSFLGH